MISYFTLSLTNSVNFFISFSVGSYSSVKRYGSFLFGAPDVHVLGCFVDRVRGGGVVVKD